MPSADGRLLDLLAVFIEAGQEKNLLTQAAPRPRDDVGDDFLVGMAEVRLAVDVINGGGDVKLFVHQGGQCDGQTRRWQSCAVSLGGASRPREPEANENDGSSVASPHLMKCSRLPQGHFVLQFLPAVAENQPANKNRMTTELSNFAARLRERIPLFSDVAAEVMRLALQDRKSEIGNRKLLEPPYVGCYENEFNTLALELFALQFKHNAAYRKICEARNLTPEVVEHWTQIPAVPTAAFKELELTCLAPAERTTVFHSSGTTEQKPSRHFHSAESLEVYEASLWPWFRSHLFADKLKLELQPSATPAGVQASACGCGDEDFGLVILTPPPVQAPHSSLVHMFETVRQKLGASADTAFVGKLCGRRFVDSGFLGSG